MQPTPRIPDKIGYRLLDTISCNKLSEKAKGKLHYQLWQHEESFSFAISLFKNESAGGFSAELIQVDDILALLEQLQSNSKPFHATVFKPLFTGKSANNHCFLAAVLLDQRLIQPYPLTERLLEIHVDLSTWKNRLQDLDAVTTLPKVDTNPSKEVCVDSEKITSKSKPKSNAKGEPSNAVHQVQA